MNILSVFLVCLEPFAGNILSVLHSAVLLYQMWLERLCTVLSALLVSRAATTEKEALMNGDMIRQLSSSIAMSSNIRWLEPLLGYISF